MDSNSGGDPYYLLLTDPLLSIVDNSLHHSKYILSPLREAFSSISKLVFRFSGNSIQPVIKMTPPSAKLFRFPHESFAALFPHTFSFKSLFKPPQPFPVLALAAALIPPFDRLASGMLAILPEDGGGQMLGPLEKAPCNVQHGGCFGLEIDWKRHAVEPKTGIQFPSVLNTVSTMENQSNLSSEVLVGTGSRVLSIIRIKTVKVYAFGFYIHPDSVCQKLGSKYGSIPAVELKDRHDFYRDLLREDIGMTVRLVVNHGGLKIISVKDAFEKSLRARLAKTNPETDFNCITKFGSYFTQDIPLPVGTVIDLRRTSDGKLITEIGGNEVGAVHSKELCRAFFDMYIGEIPVSEQTKVEIGKNVATIVGRC